MTSVIAEFTILISHFNDRTQPALRQASTPARIIFFVWTNPTAALERAKVSLDGLSVGNAFGQMFFRDEFVVSDAIACRLLPESPWYLTDDSIMAQAVIIPYISMKNQTNKRIGVAVGIMAGLVFLAVIAAFAWFIISLDYAMREQDARNEAAMPLYTATVASRLKIGDTAAHVKSVLSSAQLDFSETDHNINSRYPTGRNCGIVLKIKLDGQNRVTDVNVDFDISSL